MNNLRRSQLILALVAIIGLGLSSQAYGSWTATVGSGGGNPDEQLLFNQGGVTGTTIVGFTQQTSTPYQVVADETINGSGGQATVLPDDGRIDSLMILPDPASGLIGFSDLKFNLRNPFATGTFTLSIVDQDDQTENFFGVLNNLTTGGSNFFRLEGSDGMFIKKATLSAPGGDAGNPGLITEVTQIRVGGPVAIPEPSAFLFLGSLATLGAFGRWRKRHSS